MEVRLRGHKGDETQTGSIVVRTRSEATGERSGLDADGGAVALVVGFLSCNELPEHAPLSSCRCGGSVRVWGYGQALRSLREVVQESGRNPEEYALHSLRIGDASALAAGGIVSERVVQR